MPGGSAEGGGEGALLAGVVWRWQDTATTSGLNRERLLPGQKEQRACMMGL